MSEEDLEPPVIAVLKIEVPAQIGVKVAPACEAEVEDEGLLALWKAGTGEGKSRSIAHAHIGQTVRIGRSKNNDLVLEDANVSRFHAVISASESGAVLSDLSSLNGTFVNDRRITTPYNLKSGDILKIGEGSLLVEFQYPGQGPGIDSTGPQTQIVGMKAVDITVLLADVCGYTRMTQALPPDDVTQALQGWFSDVSRVVKTGGGEVDKYIGDCVMALWTGQVSRSGEAAIAAATAALEILALTKTFSETRWQHHATFPWTCRVVLNTGTALSGNMSGGEKREFTVLGDSINVAFRLEGIAGKLGCISVLGEETARLVGEKYPVKSVGAYELEGRHGQVPVFTFHSTCI